MSEKHKERGVEGEKVEEEEDIEFVLDTTGDPALQEDFLPFGNECNYYTDDEDEEGSVSDVQEFLS